MAIRGGYGQTMERMRGWGVLAAAGVAMVCGTVAGCGGEEDPAVEGSPGASASWTHGLLEQETRKGEPLRIVTVEPNPGEGDGALLAGRLVNVDGCVRVDTGQGDPVLPIVPRDAVLLEGGSVEGDLLYVTQKGQPRYIGTPERLGDEVELGGGLSDEVPEEAEVCGEGPVFHVVAEPMED